MSQSWQHLWKEIYSGSSWTPDHPFLIFLQLCAVRTAVRTAAEPSLLPVFRRCFCRISNCEWAKPVFGTRSGPSLQLGDTGVCRLRARGVGVPEERHESRCCWGFTVLRHRGTEQISKCSAWSNIPHPTETAVPCCCTGLINSNNKTPKPTQPF